MSSLMDRLKTKNTQAMDDMISEAWGNQSWSGVVIEANGVYDKSAAMKYCDVIADAANRLTAPIFIALQQNDDWPKQFQGFYLHSLGIAVCWPSNSDGSRILDLAINRSSKFYQQIIRQDLQYDDYARVLVWCKHAKKIWRINYNTTDKRINDGPEKREVRKLIKALSTGEDFKRRQAVNRLGELADVEAVEPLINLLSDTGVRREAIAALGALRDSRAVAAIISGIEDGDIVFDLHVQGVLSKFGPEAIEPTITLLCSSNIETRLNAAELLNTIGDERAVEPLINCLQDENDTVAMAASIALGNLGDQRAVKPLAAYYKSGRESTYMAAGSLSKLLGEDFENLI